MSTLTDGNQSQITLHSCLALIVVWYCAGGMASPNLNGLTDPIMRAIWGHEAHPKD